MTRAFRKLRAFFHKSYARALEDEVARLRAENRALINSILGLAGIPPMRIAEMNAFIGPGFNSGHCPQKEQGGPEGRPYTIEKPSVQEKPLRRRSWPQIGRMREIADARVARREREADTGNFPPPHNIVLRVP